MNKGLIDCGSVFDLFLLMAAGLKIRFQLIWSLAAARLIPIRGVIQNDDKSDWHQCGCT